MSPTSADPPRLLAIMGSGETAPTMAKVHRLLFSRSGPPPVPAVLLDTPYGFQENAEEITARTMDYFRENVGMPITLAPFRSADEDPLLRATAIAQLLDAHYVFAGPGSPSYALRQWQGSGIDDILLGKLTTGGVVTFASADALTLGAVTVPVYEIYKAGEAPRWLTGLDVLGRLGLPVAVIPHYDNAEGGSHDTRYCYLGERRLAQLEVELPDGHFVLGIDSHTALLIDFVAGTASVLGLGGVTVRVRGYDEVFPTGTTLPLAELAAAAEGLRGAPTRSNTPPRPGPTEATGATSLPAADTSRSPLMEEVQELTVVFDAAAETQDMPGAIRAVLLLENLLVAWSRDTAGTDEIDRARATLQALIVRLGALVPYGSRAAVQVPPDLVEILIQMRGRARDEKDFAAGDRIRDALVAAGIELHDAPDGTTWEPRSGS